MARVTFIINGQPRTVACDPVTLPYLRHGLPGSLLDVALNFDIPLEHACGGNCACTTCHVIIRTGAENLSDMDDNEADRLDAAWDVGPDSRLACQAVVRGDVICDVPAWNRNDVQKGGGIRPGPVGGSAGGAGEANR